MNETYFHVRSYYRDELDELIKRVLAEIPFAESEEMAVFVSRIVKAAVFVALKAKLDPAEILSREIRDIIFLDQSMMECAPEIRPHIARLDGIPPLSQAEADKLIDQINGVLEGLHPQQGAGISMMVAAGKLLNEADETPRAVALAFAQFGRELDVAPPFWPDQGSLLLDGPYTTCHNSNGVI